MEGAPVPSAHQLEDYMALLLGGAPTAPAKAWSCEPGSRRHTSCAPATPTYGSPAQPCSDLSSPAEFPALEVTTRPPGVGAAMGGGNWSRDEALACLWSRFPEADIALLMYFLSQNSDHVEDAASAYCQWKEAREADSTAARTSSGGALVVPTLPLPIPLTANKPPQEAPASPPLLPTLPLPIPLTGAREHAPNGYEEIATWEGWGEPSPPCGDPATMTEGCGAAAEAPPYTSTGAANSGYPSSCAALLGADMGAADLQGMELQDSGSHNYSAARTANAHPRFATHAGLVPHFVPAPASAFANGCSPGSSSMPGAAVSSTGHAPLLPHKDEGARQAASEAFVTAQEQVALLMAESDACFTQAINARRNNRLLEASQLERHAGECKRRARCVKDRSSLEAFQRNNKENVMEMPPIDLHDLTVVAALNKVDQVVTVARELVSKGFCSAVLLPLITGRGSHSAGGVPKIRAAVQEWMEAYGIGYRLENAGGQLVACLA